MNAGMEGERQDAAAKPSMERPLKARMISRFKVGRKNNRIMNLEV